MALISMLARRRWYVLALGAFAVVALIAAACEEEEEEVVATPTATPTEAVATPSEPLKIAMLIAASSTADEGYFATHGEALEAVRQAFGDRVQTELVEEIPVTEEFTRVAEGFAAEGFDVLIDPGAVWDLFAPVCRDHPDIVCFETYGLPPVEENVVAYYPKFWLTAYLMGIAAGHLTETGILGYLQPFEIPLVNADLNAFLLGCQSVRPDCKARRVVLNTWFDPPKEVEAANTLADAGADVLWGFIDDPSAITVAQERGIWAGAKYKDMSRFGPEAYITSALMNWDEFHVNEIQAVLDGTWSGGRLVLFDLGKGKGTDLGPWGPNIPQEVIDAVEAEFEALVAGKNPFVGPIFDQDGNLGVEEGEELSDEFLYFQWDWLVQGVQ